MIQKIGSNVFPPSLPLSSERFRSHNQYGFRFPETKHHPLPKSDVV